MRFGEFQTFSITKMKGWVSTRVAPLAVPSPLRNGTLLSYYLFTRHGARAPIFTWSNYPADQIEWKSGEIYNNKSIKRRIPIVNGKEVDFSKSPKSGRLLDAGIQQHENLGKLYYNYLAVQNKLLPLENEYDLSKIFIRSSVSPRCVESGVSFLHGMYKPKSEGEKLYIQTGQFGREILCPHPELLTFVKEGQIFKENKEFKRRISLIPQEIKDMFPNKEMVQLLAGDYPYCLEFNGNKLPKIIEDDNKKCQIMSNNNNSPFIGDLYRILLSNLAYYSTGFINFAGRITYKQIFKLFGKRLKMFLNKEADAKFTLFSGHDCTISGFLAGLGFVNLDSVPPFASHLGVGLWELNSKLVLRFAINGEVLNIDHSETMEVEKFLTKYVEPE